MTTKPGDDLESLTEQIFRVLTSNPLESGDAIVERNVMLDGADGPRQIDVLIRTRAGPIDLTTIIECKDHRRSVTISAVDALHSVAQDVGASRAVLVSRGGFSRSARQKAARLRIALYTADLLANVADEAFQVPVHVREVRPTEIGIFGFVRLDAGDEIGLTDLGTVNGQNLFYLLRDHLIADPSFADAPAGIHEWTPTGLGDPVYVELESGANRVVKDLSLQYVVAERHYFGYLTDLRQAMLLRDELEDTSQVLVEAESFIVDYSETFAEFGSVDELPLEPSFTASVAVVPNPATDLRLDQGTLTMKHVGD